VCQVEALRALFARGDLEIDAHSAVAISLEVWREALDFALREAQIVAVVIATTKAAIKRRDAAF
jgi:hypothetical protein